MLQESQAEELVAELTEVVRRQKARIEALQAEKEEAEPRRGVSFQKRTILFRRAVWNFPRIIQVPLGKFRRLRPITSMILSSEDNLKPF